MNLNLIHARNIMALSTVIIVLSLPDCYYGYHYHSKGVHISVGMFLHVNISLCACFCMCTYAS